MRCVEKIILTLTIKMGGIESRSRPRRVFSHWIGVLRTQVNLSNFLTDQKVLSAFYQHSAKNILIVADLSIKNFHIGRRYTKHVSGSDYEYIDISGNNINGQRFCVSEMIEQSVYFITPKGNSFCVCCGPTPGGIRNFHGNLKKILQDFDRPTRSAPIPSAPPQELIPSVSRPSIPIPSAPPQEIEGGGCEGEGESKDEGSISTQNLQ